MKNFFQEHPIFFLLFSIFLASSTSQAANVDENLCDQQLRNFDDALTNREAWAIFLVNFNRQKIWQSH
jgi:hypothetical protein